MGRKVLVTGIIFACVIGGAGFIYFKTSPSSSSSTPKPFVAKTIVAFGDSLFAGKGATEGHDLVSILSEKTSQTIINKSISGNTTKQALDRIDDALAEKPEIVMILLGGNDALGKVPLDTTFGNLAVIIKTFQNSGADVLLLGVQGGVLSDPYKDRFQALAKTYNVEYIPNVLKGILGHQELESDSVHPNDAGYKLIADKIYPVLTEIIEK